MNEKDPNLNLNTIHRSATPLAINQMESVFAGKLYAKVLDWSPTALEEPWKRRTWEGSQDLESALDIDGSVKQRIISLHSLSTSLPLRASKKDLEALRDRYNIHPEFLNTLAAFGHFPDPANGYAVTPTLCWDETSTSDSRSFELWYRLQYPELNHRSVQMPWSIRHTGVYHKYDALRDFSLIILIHPCQDTILETTIFDTSWNHENSVLAKLAQNSQSIHQIISDIYLSNWSPCIRDQAKAQEEINDDVQTADLKTGSLESDFRVTQQLRFLKNATITNRLLCEENLAALNQLRQIFESSHDRLQWLNINRAKASGHGKSLFLLQERIQNDLELLQHAASQRDSRINHHNQTIAGRLNKTLLTLTYNTVDDSATIKTITIFTLIFLPGSFIATVFGMNFFVFDDGSSQASNDNMPGMKNPTWTGLTVGQNFWIFIAIWLPVTALVLFIYMSVIWRRKRKNEEREKSMDLSGEDGNV